MSDTTVLDATCRVATSRDDLIAHHAIRHRVFVVEQGLFAVSDRDRVDDHMSTIHLVGEVDQMIVGAVRLYPLDQGGREWQGDRLAVAPGHRIVHLGSALVCLAVATAARQGGHVMHAHIQIPNVRFFQHLGWTLNGPVEIYAGAHHQPMAITLSNLGT